jgi:methylglutaconyl-CoA hydratase
VDEMTGDLDGALERVVRELLTSGPEAARAAKRLIRERPGGEEAAHVAARLRTSPEGQEGLRAFLEKRRAAWRAEKDAAG